MFNLINKKAKKADVGKTLTWIVATIIIFTILGISIMITNLLGNSKLITEPSFSSTDFLASQSLFSYLLTKDESGEMVYFQIKDEKDFNSYNGNLALQIFKRLYQKDYKRSANIWLGIVNNTRENCEKGKEFCILESLDNNFFGSRPGGALNTEFGYHTIPHVSEKINLDANKYLELVLIGE
jgi:hypothetical protein